MTTLNDMYYVIYNSIEALGDVRDKLRKCMISSLRTIEDGKIGERTKKREVPQKNKQHIVKYWGLAIISRYFKIIIEKNVETIHQELMRLQKNEYITEKK